MNGKHGEALQPHSPLPTAAGKTRGAIAVHLAEQFRNVDGQLREASRRAAKPGHIARNVLDFKVQAGRLLVEAIDHGMFPKERESLNGGWWDRRIGRFPGELMALYGGIPNWAISSVTIDGVTFAGDPDPLANERIAADSIKPFKPEQFIRCWTFAVGSWLVTSFPARFRHKAASWDWWHAATNAGDQLIGTDGRPLKYLWYKDGTPLPPEFEPDEGMPDGIYELRLESKVAGATDRYDDVDWLEHHRIRADIDADACRLLAELIEAGVPTQQPKISAASQPAKKKRSGRRKRKTAAVPVERPLSPAQNAAIAAVARNAKNFTAAGHELGRDRTTVRETFNLAMNKLKKSGGRTSRSVSTTALPLDRRGQVDVDGRGG